MYRFQRLTLTTKTLHRHHNNCFFSQAAAAIIEEPPSIQTTLLDGLPEPGPLETIFAIPRSDSGKNVSAKERKAGRVPSIVFEQEDGHHGGNKRLISVKKNSN
jgi:large subunit ribosomal protein L25